MTTTLVIDSSVAAKWIIAEPDSPAARALISEDHELIAPDLVLPEVANVVWKAWRQGRTERTDTPRGLRRIASLFDRIEPSAALTEEAVGLAITLDHPAYDCYFLALARSERAILVTADKRFIRRVAGTEHAAVVRPL